MRCFFCSFSETSKARMVKMLLKHHGSWQYVLVVLFWSKEKCWKKLKISKICVNVAIAPASSSCFHLVDLDIDAPLLHGPPLLLKTILCGHLHASNGAVLQCQLRTFSNSDARAVTLERARSHPGVTTFDAQDSFSVVLLWTVNRWATAGVRGHAFAQHSNEVKTSRPCLCSKLTFFTIVATSRLVLRCMCCSPRTGSVRRTTPIYTWHEQIIEWSRYATPRGLLPQCEVLFCALAARAFGSQRYPPILFLRIRFRSTDVFVVFIIASRCFICVD